MTVSPRVSFHLNANCTSGNIFGSLLIWKQNLKNSTTLVVKIAIFTWTIYLLHPELVLMLRKWLVPVCLSGHPSQQSNSRWSMSFCCVNWPKQSDKMLKLPPQRAVETSVKANASWPLEAGPCGETPSNQIICK